MKKKQKKKKEEKKKEKVINWKRWIWDVGESYGVLRENEIETYTDR